jgi:hypothetical protein
MLGREGQNGWLSTGRPHPTPLSCWNVAALGLWASDRARRSLGTYHPRRYWDWPARPSFRFDTAASCVFWAPCDRIPWLQSESCGIRIRPALRSDFNPRAAPQQVLRCRSGQACLLPGVDLPPRRASPTASPLAGLRSLACDLFFPLSPSSQRIGREPCWLARGTGFAPHFSEHLGGLLGRTTCSGSRRQRHAAPLSNRRWFHGKHHGGVLVQGQPLGELKYTHLTA